jgi:hypothetical protein
VKKFNKVVISLVLASSVAVHGLSMAHPEHDEPTPKVQQADVKAGVSGSGKNTNVHFTKGTEPVSTAGASGTLTLLGTKNKASYPLIPASNNTMTSDGLTKLANGNRAQLQVTFADKTTLDAEVTAK